MADGFSRLNEEAPKHKIFDCIASYICCTKNIKKYEIRDVKESVLDTGREKVTQFNMETEIQDNKNVEQYDMEPKILEIKENFLDTPAPNISREGKGISCTDDPEPSACGSLEQTAGMVTGSHNMVNSNVVNNYYSPESRVRKFSTTDQDEAGTSNISTRSARSERRQTSYPENDPYFVGLQDVTKKLLWELHKDEPRLSVIAIHGTGGLGKTCLARKLYNSPEVESHFPSRAWVCVSNEYKIEELLLEHLRSGWNPKCHIFIKHLYKYEYEIPLMQLTPNAVKWITWFMAACNRSEIFPSLKLFHNLFTLINSSKNPFYELKFRGDEYGYSSGDAKPVIMQSSLKNWNREWMWVQGYDLEFMPLFAKRKNNEDMPVFETFKFEGRALDKIHSFCECLGFQMTRDTFMNHRKMYELGCLPHFDPAVVEKMGKSRSSLALASKLKILGGAHQVRVPVNGPSESETETGTGKESGVQKEGGGDSGVQDRVEVVPQTQTIVDTAAFDDSLDTARVQKRQRVEDLPPHSSRPGGSGSGASGSGKKDGIGNLTMNEIAEFVSNIPEDKDWKAMDRIPMSDLVKKEMKVWAQLGLILAGAGANAHVQELEIKKLSEQFQAREVDILEKEKIIFNQTRKQAELEKELKTSKDSESGLKADLEVAAAENEKLKKQVADLEAALLARKPEEDVIDAFKDSDEYVDALAGSAADKLRRCWLVAERLLKTDPEPSWDKFVERYVIAQDIFDDTGVDPLPYDGPCLIPAPVTLLAPPPPENQD